MRTTLTRRRFIASSLPALAGLSLLGRQTSAKEADPLKAPSKRWPFYAFDNGLRTVKTVEAKVKLLHDLGYVGIEYHLNPKQLPAMLEALDKHGLQLNAVYTVPWLEAPVPAHWPEAIKLMKGRATRIEMAIRSKQHRKASDPAGDARGAELLKQVSDLCADTGPVVSTYPHTGFWTEKVDDGVRLAKKTGRKNVGTNFNLVHWHWVKQTRSVEETLRAALPHLFSVTINNGTKAGRKISSLDRGDYGLLGFLKTVKQVGYTGQVGLQCYSVPGPSEEHLKRSMATWRQLLEQLGLS